MSPYINRKPYAPSGASIPVVEYNKSFVMSGSGGIIPTSEFFLPGYDDPWTIEMWIYHPTGFASLGWNTDDAHPSRILYSLFDFGGTYKIRVLFNWSSSTDTVQFNIDSTVVAPKNEWFHFAIAYDGSRSFDDLKLYLNGVDRTNINSATDPPASGDITYSPYNPIIFGSGALLRVGSIGWWGKYLSQPEVDEIYNAGTAINLFEHSASADLQHWINFSKNSITANGAIEDLVTGNIWSYNGSVVAGNSSASHPGP